MTDASDKMLVSLTGASRFEAAMAVRPCARTAHFFVHHRVHAPAASPELSTAPPLQGGEAVDDLGRPVDVSPESHVVHLGLVVPKRHAKRSVTRSLVKREIRAGMRQRVSLLPAGDWVVRLRAPIDRKLYTSARSDALAEVLRDELVQLLADALRRASRPAVNVVKAA